VNTKIETGEQVCAAVRVVAFECPDSILHIARGCVFEAMADFPWLIIKQDDAEAVFGIQIREPFVDAFDQALEFAFH